MAGSEESKSGLTWIYQLRKEEVLEELLNRGIPASKEVKLDELRWRILKEAVRTEQEAGETKEKTKETEYKIRREQRRTVSKRREWSIQRNWTSR